MFVRVYLMKNDGMGTGSSSCGRDLINFLLPVTPGGIEKSAIKFGDLESIDDSPWNCAAI